jgi:hypothetical protein
MWEMSVNVNSGTLVIKATLSREDLLTYLLWSGSSLYMYRVYLLVSLCGSGLFYYLPPKAGFNWRGPARR